MAAASVLARQSLALALVVVAAVSVTGVVGSNKSLNITNSCSYTVWPAISSGSGRASSSSSSSAPDTTGFELAPGQWEMVALPSGWSGRVWGRTLCSTSSTTDSGGNRFTCVTGDCGTGRQDCAGGKAVPPVTLAQFTLDDGMDTYDVSLVDGFNLPLLVAPPQGAAPAGGNCAPAGCMADLNGECPDELRVVTSAAGTGAVACKSACLAFRSPQYCCTGEYYGNTSTTCEPTEYSRFFKNECLMASSYASDGAGSAFTCGSSTGTYTITFCPSTTSPNTQPQETTGNDLPHIVGATPAYTGGSQQASAASTTPWRIVLVVSVLGAMTAGLVVLEKLLGLFKLCFR